MSLLLRPNLFEDCEQWRTRNCAEGEMKVVYDGNIWKEFQNFKGEPFLSEPENLAFIFNMDFFQPYK